MPVNPTLIGLHRHDAMQYNVRVERRFQMKALLIALLVLTACGKAIESPVSPANAAQPDTKPQVVVVTAPIEQDPIPADPTFKVTFKYQYITGIEYRGNRNQTWWYTYSPCDQVRYMTDAELGTLQADYAIDGCLFTQEVRSEDFILDCNAADKPSLPHNTTVSFCEWNVPYGVAQ